MKKFAVLLFAVFAACAFGGEALDVNGSFKLTRPGAKLPDGWHWNMGPKPVGTYETVQIDGKTAVRFVGEKSMLSAVFSRLFPVVPGEKYELSVTAAGTTGKGGSVNVGIHLLDEKYLTGNYVGGKPLTGAPVTVKRVITIPKSVKGRTPTKMRVLFLLRSPGEATFTDFSAKKLD